VTPDGLQRASTRAAWRLIPLLAAGYLVSYIDRTNVGFAALTMNQALGLSATQFGFAAGVFYVGYVLLEVPSNLALRRFGARRWLARIMVTWGLAAAGTAFATGPRSLYALRLLTGAAEAGFYPGVIFYLSSWFPSTFRARAVAWFSIANPLSSVLSGPLSAALLQLDGVFGFAGWRWLFVCEGLPACALGAVTLWLLPDEPAAASWLSAEERSALAASLEAEARGVTRDLWSALRDRRVLLLTGSYFLVVGGLLAITLWLPQMLKQHGLPTRSIGLWSACPYLAAGAVMVVWASHVDRTRGYRRHYVAGCLVAAFGFALCALDSLPAILVGASVALIGMNGCRPAFFSLLSTLLGGAAAAGGIAFINSVGNLGGLVGPYAVGWSRDATGAFSAAMLALALAVAAAGLSALLLARVTPEGRAG
jgi:MFS transporter, ACS family, tartrate transporter